MSSFKPCLATQKLFKAYSALFILAIAGCGGSNRVLTSVSVSPTSADAQNFPNGQVQFTATENFSRRPSPVTVTFMAPGSGAWNSSPGATIDQNGVAQCVQGAAGTVTITATAFNAATFPGEGTLIGVSGTATLTCP